MIDLLQAVVLGIVQGLTEFLPISSTAHLRIVPALLGWPDPGAAFSAVIQCGTLAAVVAYFWRDLVRIGGAFFGDLARGRPLASLDARLGWMMIAATVPIGLLGLLFSRQIKGPLRSLYVISGAMIGVALLLVLAEEYVRRRQRRGLTGKSLEEVTWGDALAVGLAQAVALVPGSSRSGTTILGALSRGFSRETAARFSFLLSMPAIFAAGMKELVDEWGPLTASHANTTNLVVCTIVSGLVGYASIAFLLRYLRTHTMFLFIVYRLALGVFLLALLAGGVLSPLPLSEPTSSIGDIGPAIAE
jgi:undecaprenyl-diphosphatase